MKKIRAFLLILVILVFLLGDSGCSSKEKSKQGQRIMPVTVAGVTQKDVPVQIRVIGNVEPYSIVTVKSQIAGEIVKVNFNEGQDVRKGNLLFVIDPRPYEAALRQAEANLAKNSALAANSKEDLRRYSFLVEKGYVSREQFDQVRTNAAALEATMAADKAVIENTRLQIEYCHIRSPIDGRTGSLAVHQGNVVKTNEVSLVTINQVNPIYVSFSVPEQYLQEIKRHMKDKKLVVEVFTSKNLKEPETGVLTFIENTVDTSTGTIRLKGTFANKERRLWPGQFIDVMLTLTVQYQAIIVPSEAVQTGQAGSYVFVVKDDSTVEVRTITVSRTIGGETVIDKGLRPDEQVVTDGHLRLVSGAKISIKNPKEGKVTPK